MSSNCQPSILFKARAMKFGQTRVWPTDRDSARALASVGESAAEADGGRRPRQARSIATCELSFGLDMVKQSWDSSIHSPRPGYPPLNLSTIEYLTTVDLAGQKIVPDTFKDTAHRRFLVPHSKPDSLPLPTGSRARQLSRQSRHPRS